MKRAWNLAPVLQIVQKIPEDYWPCLYLSVDQVWWPKDIWFKRYIQNYTLSHVLILIWCQRFVKLWMVENTKTLISWQRNITFFKNKKILNLCLRWHIFSYHFAVELTFNGCPESKILSLEYWHLQRLC